MASGKTPKRKYKKNDIIRLSVMAVCAVVFVVCVVNLIRIFAEYKQSENYYNRINNGFDNSPANVANGFSILPMSSYVSASPLLSYKNQKNNPGTIHVDDPSEVPVVPCGNAEFQHKLAMLKELYAHNSDVFGYIQIEDTKISYPVMQGPDNYYYLKRGTNKKYLSVGSIFADYRNSRTVTENKNLILYGHNMLNGSMFHDLARFDKELHSDAESFFKSHDEIRLTTFDGIYIFKIFAFIHTDENDPYLITNFFSDAEFLEYCNSEAARSMYDTGIKISAGDTVLTLSTCVNGKPTERYACHAKLIGVQR